MDQVLWLNASLGNWSYVLYTLELKVKLTGKKSRIGTMGDVEFFGAS